MHVKIQLQHLVVHGALAVLVQIILRGRLKTA